MFLILFCLGINTDLGKVTPIHPVALLLRTGFINAGSFEYKYLYERGFFKGEGIPKNTCYLLVLDGRVT